jgi:hypothetical protein
MMADKDAKPDERYKETAGFKRNNPGNLMVPSIPYLGKSNVQQKGGPVSFCSMRWGLRALAMDLKMKTKQKTSIRQIIAMYAPASENDTEGYIKFVAGLIGKGGDVKLDWDDAGHVACMKAIIMMEIGYGTNPFSDAELTQAVADAKTQPEVQSCEAPAPYTPAAP